MYVCEMQVSIDDGLTWNWCHKPAKMYQVEDTLGCMDIPYCDDHKHYAEKRTAISPCE